jgi:hypothetical protein
MDMDGADDVLVELKRLVGLPIRNYSGEFCKNARQW